MAIRRLLVISPLFSVNAPQPARFRELVHRWSDRFEVTVVAFDTGGITPAYAGGAIFSLMKFSAAGKLLIGSRLKNRERDLKQLQQAGNSTPDGGIKLRGLIRGLLRRIHINRFFFPDVFLVEYFNIKRHVMALAGRVQPEAIIISVAPFTLMFLSGALKRRFPQLKVVIDAGDPFYGDSSSYSRRLIHRLFAKRVERTGLANADMIVVPTMIMKKHYLACYGDVTDENRIRIIENGISKLFTGIKTARTERVAPFRIVYAGRFYRKMRDPSELYRAVQEFAPGEVHLKVFGNIQEKYLPVASDKRFTAGGALNATDLAREYGESDLVVYLDNAYGVQVPGKVYEVLAVNRPVLYICRDEDSPSYEIVNGSDGIFTVTNDYRSIAAGITAVMKESAGRDYLRGSERYTFDSLAFSYGILLEELISRI